MHELLWFEFDGQHAWCTEVPAGYRLMNAHVDTYLRILGAPWWQCIDMANFEPGEDEGEHLELT